MRRPAANPSDITGTEASLSRRGFLRRAGLGAIASLAVASVGDVLLAAPSGAATVGRQTGMMTAFEDPADAPNGCIAYSTCTPCNGCCPGGPCPPKYFCFYCSATPCGPAGVACYERAPKQFYICCG